MKTKLLTLLAIIIATTSFSQTTFTVDGLDYEVISTTPNEVKITGGTPATTDLVIPVSVIDSGITYSVTVIGTSAFGFEEDDFTRSSFATITTLSIPNSVRIIEDFAFAGNQITGDLIIPNSVVTLGRFAFTENDITSVTLSNNLSIIPESAFSVNAISTIIIPNGVTTIESGAFSNNVLSSITIPNSVTVIGDFAFSDNELTSFTIPASVTSIGSSAFLGNPIEEVTCLGITAPLIESNTFSDVSAATLFVPQSTLRGYIGNGWSVFGTIVAGSITFNSAFTVGGFNYLVTSLVPEEVKVLGQEGALTVIDIPETAANGGTTYTVTSIADSAFQTNNLTELTLPNTIREIETRAFDGNALTTVVIPNSVTTLGNFVFDDNAITQLTLSNAITSIPFGAFANNQITSITIPDGVTIIGGIAFRNNQLTTVVMSNSVETIQNSAFSNNSLSSVTLSENLTSIGDFTFSNNNLTSITIPNSVTALGSSAFRDNLLETLAIPDNVNSLGSSCFQNNNLTSITFGTSLSVLGAFDTFRNNNLTTITIPSTVTSLGSGRTFRNNPITTVIVEATTPPTITSGTNDSFGNRGIIDLTVPDNTEDTYEAATWTGFKSVNGVEQINIGNTFEANGLSYRVTALAPNEVEAIGGPSIPASLVLPETLSFQDETFTLVSVANSAFENTGLTSVQLPNTIRLIDDQAFQSNQLTSLTLPNSLTRINFRAFRLNQIGGDLIIPNSVAVVENGAFEVNNLSSLTISENMIAISNQVFRSNDLTSVIIPAGINSIGDNSFRGNPLTEVTVLNETPPSINNGGNDSFFGSRANIDLTVPDTTEQAYLDNGWIGFKTINGEIPLEVDTTFVVDGLSYRITSLVPNEVEAIGGPSVPQNLTISSSVTFQDETFSVTGIGNNAYDGISLTNLVLPNTITSIGNNAFLTNQLTAIILPPNLSSIGSNAFGGNPLTAIESLNTTPPSIQGNSFGDRSAVDLTIPTNTEDAYAAAEWTGFATVNGLIPFEIGATFEVDGLSYEIIALSPNELRATGGSNIPEELVLPETINFQDETFTLVSVGNQAFRQSGLISVDFPSTIITIEAEAFRNNQLTSLTIPSTVNSIGARAFEDNNLTSVNALPNTPPSITTGTNDSFGNRSAIDLTIPPGTEATYEAATWTGFNSVNGIRDFEIGDTFVDNNLEYRVTSLIPNEVEIIGGTPATTELVILENVTKLGSTFTVTSVGDSAFKDRLLTAVTFPSTIVTIADQAFRNNQFTSLTLPEGLTSIGVLSFQGSPITSLNLPTSLISIGELAFVGAPLTSLTLPEGLVTIDDNAFRDNQLTNLTIPSTVTSIGARAFEGNPLTTLNSEAITPPSVFTETNDSFSNRQNIDLTVPDGTEDAYEAATWTGFKSVNGNIPLEVGDTFEVDGLSYRITSLAPNEVEVTGGTSIPTNLVLPEIINFQDEDFTLVSIGSTAFEDEGITSVQFPSTLRTIGGIAFRFNALTEVVIPNSVTLVAQRAFSNNDLVSVKLPESLQRIDFRSFERNEIESIDIPDNVTEIQGFAFDLNNLTELTIPAGVTSIGSEAFNRNDLTTIVSEAMTPPTIQGNSFGNRSNTDLFVPDSEGYIDANWTGFKSITEANKALFIKVFLQGAALNPFAGEENLMRDNLRLLGLLPFESPYEDAETLFDSTFVETTEGEDAIVDWIFVELRDALDSSIVIEGKSGLLQRDGDVVGVDAVSPLQFASTPDDYFIAIKHRNHLGVVLEQVKRLSPVATVLDFTKADSPISLGNNAQTDIGLPANTIGLWAGDANADSTVRFSGANAEPTDIRDGVLNNPGNIFGSLFFAPQGYFNGDVNMDGELRFSGANSEPLFIKDNILGNPGNAFNSLFFSITTQIPQD